MSIQSHELEFELIRDKRDDARGMCDFAFVGVPPGHHDFIRVAELQHAFAVVAVFAGTAFCGHRVAMVRAKGDKGLIPEYYRLIGASTDLAVTVVEKNNVALECRCSLLLVVLEQCFEVAVVAGNHCIQVAGVAVEVRAVAIVLGVVG
ncbi:MAG: hypothetical protein JRE24_03775 [Deltaproteobacteria bacterium]|nr:hypothetical protein [Deltaproteobacteria bacterium]